MYYEMPAIYERLILGIGYSAVNQRKSPSESFIFQQELTFFFFSLKITLDLLIYN